LRTWRNQLRGVLASESVADENNMIKGIKLHVPGYAHP
jgi:hypothetical protein